MKILLLKNVYYTTSLIYIADEKSKKKKIRKNNFIEIKIYFIDYKRQELHKNVSPSLMILLAII